MLVVLVFSAALAIGAHEPASSADLRLFGVEIGGPEDGFPLTEPSAFDSAKRVGARSVDLRPVWSVLEPRPGQYDWSTLDTALENAAAVGLPATITVRFFDDQIPEWLASDNTLDQDGKPFSGYGFQGVHRSLSYWGPQARPAYLRLVRQMVRRYRSNPNILAWQFFYGYNDSFYMGMWNNLQTVYDYSNYSQEAYRRYLRKEKDLSLRALNARYATSYRRWEEVVQPKPTFGQLNTSLEWHDFQDYRMWSIERMFDDIDRCVRRIDARPLIMYYGGSLHHSAHQLSVYDIGLRLLDKHRGMLDVTCFEDPVPAEIGAGIVRSYGIPLMCEAWQVPPPAPDFRRLFFHAFSLGAKSYQLVGNWEKMQTSPEEFQRTAEIFAEMAAATPVRARIAGLISYRTITSHIPARAYINPTLALVPKLQERQYSLDWHSDMSPLDDLAEYRGLLDANSEVLERRVIERLGHYVEEGGRLALLCRSGRYALEEGLADFPLLRRLKCPNIDSREIETWNLGKGHVLRVGAEMDWTTPEGIETLLRIMDWWQEPRPVTATPGVLAALSRNQQDELYVVLFQSGADAGEFVFSISANLLGEGGNYQARDLFHPEVAPLVYGADELSAGVGLAFEGFELKVIKLIPKQCPR